MQIQEANAQAQAPANENTTNNNQTSLLQLQDLQNLLQIVDYAAEQGAFKGWNTITQVFAVRQRLYNFLQSVAPPSDNNKQKEENSNSTNQNNQAEIEKTENHNQLKTSKKKK